MYIACTKDMKLMPKLNMNECFLDIYKVCDYK